MYFYIAHSANNTLLQIISHINMKDDMRVIRHPHSSFIKFSHPCHHALNELCLQYNTPALYFCPCNLYLEKTQQLSPNPTIEHRELQK